MEFHFKKTAASAIFSILFTTPAFAETPDYNFVDAKYVHINLDGVANLDGFVVDASTDIRDNWFAFGSYLDAEEDGVSFTVPGATIDLSSEVQEFEVGMGHYWNTSEKTNVFLAASYLNVEVSAFRTSVEENGYALATGIRSNLSEKFELAAQLGYASVGEADGTELGVGAVYRFNDTFGLVTEATYDNDSNASVLLGARINF